MALQSSLWPNFFAICLGLLFDLGSGDRAPDEYDLPQPGRPLPGDCDERLLNPTMVLTSMWSTEGEKTKIHYIYKEKSIKSQQVGQIKTRYADAQTENTILTGTREGDWIRLPRKRGFCLMKDGPHELIKEMSGAQIVEAAWHTISSTQACEDKTENRLSAGPGFATLETCKAKCFQEEDCTAIDYFAQTAWCSTYKKPCITPTATHDGASSYKFDVNGGLPKVKDSMRQYLRCLRSIIIAGRELDKSMKIASWRNNRYRQAFESVIAYWGYMAGLPWDNENATAATKDAPLDNLISNSKLDRMTGLHFGTKKVDQLFQEFDYYAGVKQKKKKAKWQHLESPPKPPPIVEEDEEDVSPDVSSSRTAVSVGSDARGSDPRLSVDTPTNRETLLSREPISRNFSDFFWHPKPNQRDESRKRIVHGDQIPRMIPDSRLKAHGYNPTMVYDEMHTHDHDPGPESLKSRRDNILGNQGNPVTGELESEEDRDIAEEDE